MVPRNVQRPLVNRWRKRLSRVFEALAYRVAPPPSPFEQELTRWRAARGDETLRVDYDLDADSVVLDLGGYKGQWTSDITARYGCRIHVFEPVPAFAQMIVKRFEGNRRVEVHAFGLAPDTGMIELGLSDDASSYLISGGPTTSARLVAIGEFLADRSLEQVDLVKINIEGAEYELLEHLISTGLIGRFRDVQVQFHDFVPQAAERMARIRSGLGRTHRPTYQYRFVWENWRRSAPPAP